MSVQSDFDAMINVANVFRFIVVCARNFFLGGSDGTLSHVYPVWVPLSNQIQKQLQVLSDRELDMLDDILEGVGVRQGKELKIELDDNGIWFMTISPILPDFDPGPDDDDTDPRPEYEEPKVLKAMAAGTH